LVAKGFTASCGEKGDAIAAAGNVVYNFGLARAKRIVAPNLLE
jgi:hypothetical protein